MIKKIYLAALCLLCVTASATAQNRSERLFDEGWRFTRQNDMAFVQANYDDTKWQEVTVPHDWAIYGPFDRNNDLQVMAIVQDGQNKAMEHTGRTGGLPFEGFGWYRLKFDAPEFTKGKSASIIFDGAMSEAHVWVNGKEVGNWPFGYNSFHFDITDYLEVGKTNTLVVRLENKPNSSRWYPGAGIYRNVRFIVTSQAHVPVWGTQLTTPEVSKEYAKVNLRTKLEMPQGANYSNYTIKTDITDQNGEVVTQGESTLTKFNKNLFDQDLYIENPKLWSPDSPTLYTAKSTIYENGKAVDTYSTRFGVRTLEIVPNVGMFLNGEIIKFQGVCNHHDLGPLGGVANMAGIRRQIRILKEMGANAIRTSHNMPAPELIEACDEMGMLVMAETFDEWKTPKLENGYHRFFDEWAERDLVNLIHQFRNSASVVMWCVGNEVPDQWSGNQGAKLSRYLQDICHREDPTRLVTMGMDAPDAVTTNNIAAVFDVAGFNYRPHLYAQNYERIPQQIVLGSETASTVSSRGVYKFPVERASMKKYSDHQSSSYDVEHCAWSNLPEDDFMWHEDKPWSIGEFVWTGFDYIGEPTPYYSEWPSHSSLFGIVDLAGLPKDRYWLYRSHWNKDVETLHILPHWNWEGRQGEVTPIFVYTNYPSAEVFINGKSQGRRTKDLSVTIENSADAESMKQFKRQSRYRLMWMDTKYEAGEVKVVAYNDKGEAVAEKVMKTAGKPYAIKLEADRSTIDADGKDLSFITVSVVDRNGNPCPLAANEIEFEVKGEGSYRAGASGDPSSLELFHLPKMKLFSGMMTAIVESTKEAGEIVVRAKSKGLKSETITITTK